MLIKTRPETIDLPIYLHIVYDSDVIVTKRQTNQKLWAGLAVHSKFSHQNFSHEGKIIQKLQLEYQKISCIQQPVALY